MERLSSEARSADSGAQISPAPVGRHESDRFRGHVGGGQHEVALVFTVLIVGDDHHFALPQVGDQILYRIENKFAHRINSCCI